MLATRRSRPWPTTLGLALLLVCGAAAAPGGAQPDQLPALRILVTNDDGIESPGLTTLVASLSSLGEVVVSAPDGNRSGSSQAIALTNRVTAREVNVDGASRALAVDVSPAGAADFGIAVLGKEKPFDIVVSGINRGANVGVVSHLSGTVGAAMQAALRGVPAIAVSQDARSSDFRAAAEYTVRFVEALAARGFDAGVVYSINVPAEAASGGGHATAKTMGGSYIRFGDYQPVDAGAESPGRESPGEESPTGERDATEHWRMALELVTSSDGLEGTDTGAYLEGAITVTPLRFDWTDEDTLVTLDSWLPQPGDPSP